MWLAWACLAWKFQRMGSTFIRRELTGSSCLGLASKNGKIYRGICANLKQRFCLAHGFFASPPTGSSVQLCLIDPLALEPRLLDPALDELVRRQLDLADDKVGL